MRKSSQSRKWGDMTKSSEELLLERIAHAVEQIAANTNDTRHLLKDIGQAVYITEAKIEAIRIAIEPLLTEVALRKVGRQ